MRSSLLLPGALLIANLILIALAAPTSKRTDLPIAIPDEPSPGPPGYSGDPYGSPNLSGHNGNLVNTQDSAVVSDYQLVPGQEEDADLGLHLDLESVSNPQPIRGSLGGTDPSPRMQQHLLSGRRLLIYSQVIRCTKS